MNNHRIFEYSFRIQPKFSAFALPEKVLLSLIGSSFQHLNGRLATEAYLKSVAFCKSFIPQAIELSDNQNGGT